MQTNPARALGDPRTHLRLTVALLTLLLVLSGCSTAGSAVPVSPPPATSDDGPGIDNPGTQTLAGTTDPGPPTDVSAAVDPGAPTTPETDATGPAQSFPPDTASSSVPPTATSGLPESASPSPFLAPPVTPVPFAAVGLPGVNDPSCTSEYRPVVLLHGTLATAQGDFGALAPALQASGRCVFTVDYGMGGIRSVRSSAKTVSAFVDHVLATTGADQVDVIGYSQGGLVLRTALRLEGLAPKVGVAVLVAPTFHGSTSPLLTALPPALCPACADQATGSPLLQELDAGGDLDGDVRYAVISSARDTVVTPVSAQSPVGPPDRVTSLLVQDRCPDSRLDHLALRGDPGVINWVVQALETDGRPDPSAFSCP